MKSKSHEPRIDSTLGILDPNIGRNSIPSGNSDLIAAQMQLIFGQYIITPKRKISHDKKGTSLEPLCNKNSKTTRVVRMIYW